MPRAPKVEQKIIGRSLRSLRTTKTMRAANRWTVFTDGGSQIRKIRDANDLRSYIYSLSVFSQDVQSLIPSKGLRKLNNLNLKTGRILGDINAINNSISGYVGKYDVGSVGERFVRRAGGRIAGKAMGVIPQGQNAFSRLLTRSARSVVGANVTIEIDKRMRKLRPGTVATQARIELEKVAGAGNFTMAIAGEAIKMAIGEYTPVDTAALINSLYSKEFNYGNKGNPLIGFEIGIGGVDDMPDPRVPYPHIVEFGINKGFNQGTQHYDILLPIPARFQYLRAVSGPTVNNQFHKDYKTDNRGPYFRSTKNRGKGAMVRTGIAKAIRQNAGKKVQFQTTTKKTFQQVYAEAQKLGNWIYTD